MSPALKASLASKNSTTTGCVNSDSKSFVVLSMHVLTLLTWVQSPEHVQSLWTYYYPGPSTIPLFLQFYLHLIQLSQPDEHVRPDFLLSWCRH